MALADGFFFTGAFGATFKDVLDALAFWDADFADFASRACAAVKPFCKLLIIDVFSRFDRERSSTCACKSSLTFVIEAS